MRLAALFTALCLCTTTHAQTPQAYKLEGDIQGAHDPSMIHAGDTWYVFTTGRAPGGGQLGIRCSPDLTHWKACGQVFDAVPQWIKDHSPGTRDLWAPDISFEHGQYRLYYAYSLFGKNTSGIALATNRTLDAASPDYKWNDEGLILETTQGFTAFAIEASLRHDHFSLNWITGAEPRSVILI